MINKGDIILVRFRECENPDADVILRCYAYETEFGDESEDDSTDDIEDVWKMKK